MLRRRCASLEEQSSQAFEARQETEKEALLEGAEAKARILWLEEYKLGASERIDRLNQALEGAKSKVQGGA